MRKTNLKEETLEVLKNNGKSINDVVWIGSSDGKIKIDIDTFLEVADAGYNSSYGSEEVNLTLVIVGTDWWMERHEYDGSEWWEFKTMPVLVEDYKFGARVFRNDEYEDDYGIIDNLTYVEREATKRNLI